MSCSSELRVFQMLYPVAYKVVIPRPQFWHHHACYKYNFHCIQAGTRTLLVALSLACLEMSFVVKGPGAVILLFRVEYKTSVVCHNVNTQKVKIARRDRPHILASNL